VNEAQVVVLLEIVIGQLPVGRDLVGIFAEGRRAGDRHLLEPLGIAAQPFAQRRGVRIKVDEQEAAALLELHLAQRTVLLVQMKGIEIGRGQQRALGTEGPHVIWATKLRLPPRRLVHQAGAAMRADVVEGAHPLVAAADDQQRGACELQVAAHEAARLGQFAGMADVDPTR
jgi:hypothetical protein